MTNFDFHGAVRVGGAESVRSGIRSVAGVRAELDNFGWTLVDAAAGKGHVIEEQSGVFRTNCLDWCAIHARPSPIDSSDLTPPPLLPALQPRPDQRRLRDPVGRRRRALYLVGQPGVGQPAAAVDGALEPVG